MRKRPSFRGLLMGMSLLAIQPAWADRHEYSGATTSSLTFRSAGTDFALDLGYNFAMDSSLQLGGVLGLRTSPFSLSILAGPTLNFGGSNITDAFYVSGKIGVLDDEGSGFALEGRLGKRFIIVGNLSYNPFIRYVVTGAGRGSFFQIGLVSVSLFF